MKSAWILPMTLTGLCCFQPVYGQSYPTKFDCVIAPKDVIELGSAGSGILREVLVESGDRVEKDQIIARLDDDIERANVELVNMRATNGVSVASNRKRMNYFSTLKERAVELYEEKVSSLERMEKADVEAELARFELQESILQKKMAQVELTRAKALLEQKTIRAPMDAVVTEKHLAPGSYIHEQSILMTLAAIDPLVVEVFVPVSQYGRIAVSTNARVTGAAPIGGVYNAKVSSIDPVLDAASGTFRVRLALPNEDYAIPGGLRCQVSFTDGPGNATLDKPE